MMQNHIAQPPLASPARIAHVPQPNQICIPLRRRLEECEILVSEKLTSFAACSLRKLAAEATALAERYETFAVNKIAQELGPAGVQPEPLPYITNAAEPTVVHIGEVS